MSALLQHVSIFFKSGKPHHLVAGFLFLSLIGLNGHLYAEQSKSQEQQLKKADKETIVEMLNQNKELIDIQRQSQVLQSEQWHNTVVKMAQIEADMMREDMELKTQIVELKSSQKSTEELIKRNAEASEAILKKLDKLSKDLKASGIEQ